jgi:ribosome-binding protein aMBF1 (putative translation factor)
LSQEDPRRSLLVAVPEVGNNLRIAIQQARQAKGWTQKELAQKLNEPAQIVNQCVL